MGTDRSCVGITSSSSMFLITVPINCTLSQPTVPGAIFVDGAGFDGYAKARPDLAGYVCS